MPKTSGYFTIVSPEGSLIAEGETLRCIHCQITWQIKPGSGRERGWCFKCHGPTCGRKGCQECSPWERQMEIAERRLLLRHAIEKLWGV